ncbi:hypothetical protein, partial [Sutterella massiliensis]|uniref:hypothetical protein n=1 Tax=Sutterella massiliensis TaxID=1816689 RepID=UPI00195FF58E
MDEAACEAELQQKRNPHGLTGKTDASTHFDASNFPGARLYGSSAFTSKTVEEPRSNYVQAIHPRCCGARCCIWG